MQDEIKKQLDELIEKVVNPEGITELFSRKLFLVNSPCHKWSYNNQMIMILNNTYDCRGYRQWQAVDRQVKKGSKAVKILSPLMKTFYFEDEETHEKTKQKRVVGFKWINVFKVEDTDGEDLPEYVEVMEHESKKHELPLYDLAVNLGIDVSYAPSTGDYYGYYRSGEDKKIVLCTDSTQTFYHELCHAIDDKLGNLTHGKGQKADNEIVAELCGCFLASLYGQKAEIKKTHDYIKSYSGDDHISKSIFKYFERVEEILNYIFSEAIVIE